MNDSTIIKAISTVHSAIIDLLIIISITLFTIYFTLHIGLKLDSFILPGLKIEQLYIKWDEKIVVNIDSIKITKSNTKSKFDIKSLDANKLLKNTQLLDTFFSEVHIRHIQVNEINATFSYKENYDAYIKVDGPTLNLLANIDMNDHLIHISIKEFTESSTKTTMKGDIIADTLEQRIYANISLNAADTLPLDLFLLADIEKVQLWGKGSKVITKDLDPVVNMISMHEAIKPWIAEYLKGEALHLEYFKGTLFYDDPITFLDTLNVVAYYENAEYIFAPGYAPAIAPRIDLSFKDRILYIYPRNATFYGQPGGKTWITIDFETPTNPLLSVDVDLTARLTPKLVTWLKGYNIQLPFYQTKGKTKVKLDVWVTLGDIEVTAKGYFSTKKASFNFSDTDIIVKDVYVKLDNTDVDISRLNATLLDKAVSADVTGKFDPVTGKGRFDVKLKHVLFGKGKNTFALSTKHKRQSFSYILEPKADRLLIPKSYWRFGEKEITVNSVIAPFNFAQLRGNIPTTLVSVDNDTKAYVTGSFDIKDLKTDLMVDLLKLKTPTLTLNQTNTPLQVIYNDGLIVKVLKPSNWDLDGSKLTVNPSELLYKENIITIKDAHVAISDLVDSRIQGSYNINDGHGELLLKELHAQLGDKKLLEIDKDIKINIEKDFKEHFIEIPIFNLKIKADHRGWDMGIKNIKQLSSYSPLLQEYNITAGSIHMRSKNSGDKISLYGHIPYPYNILVKGNKPIETINFNGSYQDETLNLLLNNNIKAQLKDSRLTIKTEKIGINLFTVLDFIADHPSKGNNKKKSNFKVDIEATQSYLYINEYRRALADKLLLQYSDEHMNVQLLHGSNGGAFLEYKDKEFFIYGDNFNDKFMDGLAEFSDFKGGKFSFYITGDDDKIDAVVQIKDTIIKDYKSLNNIFAFMNTIPALVTFSVPHYNTNGMKVQEAYASLSIKNKMMDIKGFHVKAEEMAFNGKGSVNITEMTQDVEISLVTEATTNLSKIPILGFILVGKEDNTATTTITMTGPLEDPVVKNTLAKDIGIGTFNIIKRTLTFPIHYIDKAQKSLKKAEKKE